MQRSNLILLLIATSLFAAGFVALKDPFFQIRKNFTIFSEVISEVNELYVVDIDPERTIRRGINAMLETLDPYTVLIDESRTQEIDIITTGSYAGIGIEVGARGGELVIIAPIDGYSAQRKGVRAGDVIVSVNGIPASELSPDDLNAQIRGQAGTTVELVLRRLGIDEDLVFELERERIEIKNIEWFGFANEEERIGYILLTRFTQNSGADVRRAIQELEESGELNGLILDLRNNPGGLLIEAVRVADLFLPEGKDVVRTQGRASQTRNRYRTENRAIYEDRPLVVLQNGGSASSSEIVSGALQDHDRAVVMGDGSFGKGLVQIIRPISYGMALKITTSKYFIPSGRYIQTVDYSGAGSADEGQVFTTFGGREVFQRNGIEPDIRFDSRPENMLEVALIRGNHFFFFANEYAATDNGDMPVYGRDDEALFEAFLAYLDEADFEYQSRAQRRFEEFSHQFSEDYGPSSDVDAELERIRQQLETKKQREMSESREMILRELYLELSTRFDGTNRRQQTAVQIDPLVSDAVNLLLDQESYSQILKP